MDNLEYPEETKGTKMAREIRADCNQLSEEEIELNFNQALDIIYKNYPEQDPRKLVSETKLLDSIFKGEKRTWRGHELFWCDVCETIAIKLKCCGQISCSGGGCKVCCCENEGCDSTDFSKLTKSSIENYLTEEENKTLIKIQLLKDYILESLAAGFNEINWKYLHESGKTCDLAYDLFEELGKFDKRS